MTHLHSTEVNVENRKAVVNFRHWNTLLNWVLRQYSENYGHWNTLLNRIFRQYSDIYEKHKLQAFKDVKHIFLKQSKIYKT